MVGSRFFEIAKSILVASARRKQVDQADLDTSNLKRCLSAWELTLFGVGSTIGPGLYVISGQVARETAGPGVIASYTIAALACLLSAMCYAEFAVRLPKAGSSYTYCYATVGELFAFIVGWNVIFENIVGFATVAKAWSQYLDSFTTNKTIQHHLEKTLIAGQDPVYFDVIAFSLVLIFTAVVIIGAHVTSTANIAFTAVNMLVCVLIVGFGVFHLNFANWQNFAPYGLSGIIRGSGKCFYSMIGFDVVATTCEETQNKKTVPKAMLLTLLVCYILYFSTSSVLTLIIPWDQIDVNAAFPAAFEALGASWGHYVIAIGAMSSLSATILGGLYAAARVSYSMAMDGLIFRQLSFVADSVKTPVVSSIIVGFIGALMSLIFDLPSLVEMMSIGTLMAYSGVSASVLILRYQSWTIGDIQADEAEVSKDLNNSKMQLETTSLLLASALPSYRALPVVAQKRIGKLKSLKARLVAKLDEHYGIALKFPTEQSGKFAMHLTALYCGLVVITALFANFAADAIMGGALWAIMIFIFFGGLLFIVAFIFTMMPQNSARLHFKVPAMPIWCLVSLTLNLSIMMTLSTISWIRVVVWISVGMAIYFGYGVKNSVENRSEIREESEAGRSEFLEDSK